MVTVVVSTEQRSAALEEPAEVEELSEVEVLSDVEEKPVEVEELAELACQVNEQSENIGARRLHTMLERLLDQISFDASDKPGKSVTINKAYVDQQLGAIAKNEDLSRYIL